MDDVVSELLILESESEDRDQELIHQEIDFDLPENEEGSGEEIYRLFGVDNVEIIALRDIIDSDLCEEGAMIGYDSKGFYTNCPYLASSHESSKK